MSEITDNEQEINYLEMSDEDIANMELPTELEELNDDNLGEEDGQQTDESGNGSEGESGAESSSGEGSSDSGSGASDEGEEEENSDEITEGETGEVEPETSEEGDEVSTTNDSGSEGDSGQDSPEDDGESGQSTEKTESSPTQVTEISAEDAYKQVMAPFKANGKQMQVKSVDEVRRLMSMGANYNSKMAALKPNMKILKMLENNNILDEEKLSFLIDLSKKDPAAITKLVKDSGVNPLDIDVEKDSGYESKTYTVSDSEVDLDQVLADIRGTDSGKRTIDVISNRWDEASKQKLVSDPSIIRNINEQMENGIYDEIVDKVDHARMMGEFKGVTDIEAYRQMGSHMQANRLFKGMDAKPAPATMTKPEATEIVAPVSKADDLQLKNRKKAAGATKNSGGSKKKKLSGIDVLGMSDEDFAKLSAPI